MEVKKYFSSGVCHSLNIGRCEDIRKIMDANAVGPFHPKFTKKISFLKEMKEQRKRGCGLIIKKNDILTEKHDFVYNVQVEDNENFIANNIIVHNCGIICAKEDNKGVVGIAPKAKLIIEVSK